MSDIQNIVFIGAGNVAANLASALHSKGKNILQVYSRTEASAKALAVLFDAAFTNQIQEIISGADLYIISVSDDALPDIVERLNIEHAIVVHTSGTLPMDILNHNLNAFGVFYPLQSLKKEYLSDFQNLPLLIEGSNPTVEHHLQTLACEISANVHVMDSEQRKWVHLAAVFACNFGNYMNVIAEDILNEHNISFSILQPLLQQMNERLKTTSPRQLQTGPAIRKDYKIMEQHAESLKTTPGYQAIYQLISGKIMEKF